MPVNFDLEPRVEVHQKAENGEPIRNVRIWKDNLGVCLANEEVDKWGFSRNLREKYVQIVRELGVPSSVRNPSSYSHSCFTLNYYFAPDQNNIELTQILFSGMGRRILTPELKKLNKIALKNGS